MQIDRAIIQVTFLVAKWVFVLSRMSFGDKVLPGNSASLAGRTNESSQMVAERKIIIDA